MFVKGQKPFLKAILPEGNPDIDFRGFKVGGITYEGLEKNDIEMQNDGTVISAKFIDKTALGINVSIVGIDLNRGTLRVGFVQIGQESLENGSYKISNQQIGIKIGLIAEPKENFEFLGWSVDGAHASSDRIWTYVVGNQDAEITPIFTYKNGALTFTIDPRTNFGGYEYNKIAFQYTNTDGVTITSKGMGNASGPEDITWNNKEIVNIQADQL